MFSLVLAVAGRPAAAQSGSAPKPTIVKVGDPCKTRTDPRSGVVKIDACGRWYCGRKDVKDIIEVRPNIADVLNCTWRLEGEQCRCRRNAETTKGP
jgi:hypothetical protein